jgi:hypothetical protein
MVLAVLVIVIGGLYLWQRNTVVKQVGQINALTVTNADLTAQIVDYKETIVKSKKTQAQHQKITNDAATLMVSVNKIKATKCIGENDEKTISDITYFFNSRGLLNAGSPKANGQVLPVSGTSDISGWTVKQVIENYLVLIDYTLKLEKTVVCYE